MTEGEARALFTTMIDRIQDTFPACNASEWKLYVEGDFSSDAKFFVAVGVLAFLYVLVALGLYCFFNALYENNDLVPIGVSEVSTCVTKIFFISFTTL
ncbi:Synaptophysin-like protein 2 [Portunus trituberculatus]|uniref:Synaptophysin-like protein 2 n=1 Tax=Portunus trituberculatus TaxID=210409 RepID=A0A5B7F3L7_PORTR|nr:Synaptophysin-like protein 2 [Portunus trituberculatus]